jgi:hypothetical protein
MLLAQSRVGATVRLRLLPTDRAGLHARGGSGNCPAEGQRRIGWVAKTACDHGGPEGQNRRAVDAEGHIPSEVGKLRGRKQEAPGLRPYGNASAIILAI